MSHKLSNKTRPEQNFLLLSIFYSAARSRDSLICLRLVILTDLEVSQFVRLLVRRHHSQPVPEVVFLQVLLGEVLQIPEKRGNFIYNTN